MKQDEKSKQTYKIWVPSPQHVHWHFCKCLIFAVPSADLAFVVRASAGVGAASSELLDLFGSSFFELQSTYCVTSQ